MFFPEARATICNVRARWLRHRAIRACSYGIMLRRGYLASTRVEIFPKLDDAEISAWWRCEAREDLINRASPEMIRHDLGKD